MVSTGAAFSGFYPHGTITNRVAPLALAVVTIERMDPTMFHRRICRGCTILIDSFTLLTMCCIPAVSESHRSSERCFNMCFCISGSFPDLVLSSFWLCAMCHVTFTGPFYMIISYCFITDRPM